MLEGEFFTANAFCDPALYSAERLLEKVSDPHFDKYPSSLYERIHTFSQNESVRQTTVALLRSGNPNLSTERKIATVLFSAFVVQTDNLLDSATFPSFETTDDVKKHLLDQASLRDDLNTMNNFIPEDSKAAVEEFLHKMLVIHKNQEHKGIAGSYTFDDAFSYKYDTNGPYLETGFKIVQAPYTNKDLIYKMAVALQFVDDYMDFRKDREEGIKNLFIGINYDLPKYKQIYSRLINQTKGTPHYTFLRAIGFTYFKKIVK